ncbi:DNA mismatch repair protein mutS [Glycine soja]|nr:DNA mismatch repair protein mutS [Glycine soja]
MEDDGGESSSFVVGIIENRAKEVGLAAFDLRSASLHLSQYIETSSSYQNTKTLLHFYDPIVIIIPPNKLASNSTAGVTELVDRFYGSVKQVMLARGCFDDTKGAILIKNLAAKEPSALGLDTYYKQYYLCLAAAAATLKWTEAEKGVVVTNHSLSVTFNGSFDHMNIDSTSIQNLEIIEPFHSTLLGTSNKKRSLFHMLKTTKTIGGSRLLRANLLQPLKDIETINARLDCLAKKVTAEALAVDRAKKSQVLVSSVILLKTALDAFPLLSKVLKDVKSSLLSNIYKSVCENEKYDLIRKSLLIDIQDQNLQNGPLAIDSGRHPILESIHNDFVANNIFLTEALNMAIVMGPNMSGKSTYLQQVCLIVILAQVGCYVPARFSTVRVVDRMFTRMGAVDNLESNSSTFMTEMKETAFIMQNVSQRSLIVMDELGRATSSSDGFAIAWSCCEHLLSLKT